MKNGSLEPFFLYLSISDKISKKYRAEDDTIKAEDAKGMTLDEIHKQPNSKDRH